MEQPKPSGRTAGDTVIEVLSNWKLIAVVVASLVVAFLIVITDAEPGSTVEVFGVKYQRARAKPATSPTQVVSIDSYALPRGEAIRVDQLNALPILDGTLAIEPMPLGVFKPDGSVSSYLGGASIVGPNISKIRVGSRSLDGRRASLSRPSQDEERANFSSNSYVEVEYRGNYFTVLGEAAGDQSMRITIKQLKEPTLELVPVAQLPVPSSE